MNNDNLWAPWRMEYIKGLTVEHKCFICHYLNNPDADRDNLVLWRSEHALTVFNRFPYNNGHLLIAPKRHIANMDQATETELFEMTKLIRETQKALTIAIAPHGFNVGINFGRCAGAGLPDHMHIHIVPRWNGDTNFMAISGQTDVISQGLDDLYNQLTEISAENNFPQL